MEKTARLRKSPQEKSPQLRKLLLKKLWQMDRKQLKTPRRKLSIPRMLLKDRYMLETNLVMNFAAVSTALGVVVLCSLIIYLIDMNDRYGLVFVR